MIQLMQSNIFRRKLQTLILAVFLVMLWTPAQAATPMPSFSLSDARSGKSITSKEFEGKALLVTFFGTFCGPCIKEVPDLIDLQKRYSKDGFSVLALSVDRGGSRIVKKLINKYSINYPVLMANPKTGRDFGGVRSVPANFLVNKRGNVVKRYRPGAIPHNELEMDIKALLN